ncbi:GNAT family N-acetyltransferase [Anaerolineales bacterium HSG24]|nr:GNAT family N-acetyltransferase [Anaerolineales bacterium HSG24]
MIREGGVETVNLSQIPIHTAELVDIELCSQLDMSYTTEYVWQVHARDYDRSINLRFDSVRLPRAMPVDYPRDSAELTSHWQRQACFLVAYNELGEVLGFVDGYPEPWQEQLTVLNFVIDRPHRQQGIGTELLKATKQWAVYHGLHRLTVEMQTKNHPAISFFQKHGFEFCGYNEKYYVNGDIALFFSGHA